MYIVYAPSGNNTYLHAIVGQFEKIRRTFRTHGTKSYVIEAKIFGSRENIGICINSSNELTHDDA